MIRHRQHPAHKRKLLGPSGPTGKSSPSTFLGTIYGAYPIIGALSGLASRPLTASPGLAANLPARTSLSIAVIDLGRFTAFPLRRRVRDPGHGGLQSASLQEAGEFLLEGEMEDEAAKGSPLQIRWPGSVFTTGTCRGGWFDLHRLGMAKQLLQPFRNQRSFFNERFLLAARADGIE